MRTKKPTLSAKGRRAKGHAFERFVASKMREVFPDAHRKLEYQKEEAKGVDIENTGRYLIQCKRNKKYAPLSAIEEVQVCPIDGGIPVLITQGDGAEPLACLSFNEFLKLLKASRERRWRFKAQVQRKAHGKKD